MLTMRVSLDQRLVKRAEVRTLIMQTLLLHRLLYTEGTKSLLQKSSLFGGMPPRSFELGL